MRALLRARARNELADSIAARGPTWINAAESVRSGFENCWITPALDALERAFRALREDEEADD